MVVKLGEKGALRKGSDCREVRATLMRRRFTSNNQVVKPAESAIFAGNDIWSSTLVKVCVTHLDNRFPESHNRSEERPDFGVFNTGWLQVEAACLR